MEDNFDFFNMTRDRKIIPSESKAKWEFIKRYTFLMLFFITIYRIVFFIVNSHLMDVLNNFQSTISDSENYIETVKNQTCIIVFMGSILVLCNFLVVIVSSLSFFDKYSIKQDYYKSLQKTIIIIELIFIGVLSFYFSVQYTDDYSGISVDRFRLEKLAEKDNQNKNSKQQEQVGQTQINEYIGKLQNIYLTCFISLMLFNVLCAILCIFIQSNILCRGVARNKIS